MATKQWDDRDIIKASAGLDAELDEIFAEMEEALGPPRGQAASRASESGSQAGDRGRRRAEGPLIRVRAGRVVEDDDLLTDNDDLFDDPDPLDAVVLPRAANRSDPKPPILTDDFERSAAAISPASVREDLEDAPLDQDFDANVAGFSSTDLEDLPFERTSPPSPRRAPAPPAPDGDPPFARALKPAPPRKAPAPPEEIELPEAEILPDDADDSGIRAATVADLTPSELARLIERAVTKGILAALEKKNS